ncbi:histidine kinase [Georgenia sunbinii]|uniref:histidine kinase n=1 Tax=Georgenia sunbinii TaxID=3117728 RepID=UPI002F2629F9
MDLSAYLSGIRDSLTAATRTAPDAVQQAADDLAQVLEPSLRLTLMELASDIASEVTVELDGDVVEVRLRGGQPEIVVQHRPRAEDPTVPVPPVPPAPPPPPAPDDGEGATARVSLRLPENVKERVEDAAAREGVSVNTWLVRAAQAQLTGARPASEPQSTTGRRLTGWAR